MKRIDTINARENMFGIGKSGFHDNADLPGQDATYVSPEWFNTVQEELCNLLELRGITLDPASKRQLYDLLTTQADLEDLADEIEANFLRKNQIIDNLTTNDADKVASARTVKELQDTKLDKTDLNNTLISTSTAQALTAAQGKVLNDKIPTTLIRALCTFDGSSTPIILFHDNIASITVSTLKFSVRFVTPMPKKDYVINGFAADVANTNRLAGITMNADMIANKTVNGFDFYVRYSSNSSLNIASPLICFSIMC